MSSENTRELHKTLNASLQKHTYFLLTAAGAGIALAVNQTHLAVMTCTQIPLAFAVLSWAASFFSGCRYVDFGRAFLHTNIALHTVEAGKHPMAGIDPEKMQIGSETLRKILEEQSDNQQLYGKSQFVLLIVGGIFYVAWHIFEMYVRTFPQQ